MPPHDVAVTLLLCERAHGHAAADVDAFDVVLYFDEIAERIGRYPAPVGEPVPIAVRPIVD